MTILCVLGPQAAPGLCCTYAACSFPLWGLNKRSQWFRIRGRGVAYLSVKQIVPFLLARRFGPCCRAGYVELMLRPLAAGSRTRSVLLVRRAHLPWITLFATPPHAECISLLPPLLIVRGSSANGWMVPPGRLILQKITADAHVL